MSFKPLHCHLIPQYGLLGALFLATVAAEAAALRLGSDVWPPFTDKPEQARVALEIVHTALERSDIPAETSILTFGDVISSIKKGELDGSAALWRDPEREALMLYSEPYLENRLILVGRSGADVSMSDFSALRGRKVALVRNYAYGIDLERAGPEFIQGENLQVNLTRLLDGAVDYILVEELVIRHVIQSFPEQVENRLVIGKIPMITRTLHFAVRRDTPRCAEIVESFNARVRDMQADGSYNRILRLSWIKVDIDGDGQFELIHAGKEGVAEPSLDSYGLFVSGRATYTVSSRYVIDGELYQGWDAVPEKYKASAVDEEDVATRKAAPLMQLKF